MGIRDGIESWETAKGYLTVCLRKPGTGRTGEITEQFINMEKYVRAIDGNESVVVTGKLCNLWGVSEKDVFKAADENNNVYDVKSLDEILGESGCTPLVFLGRGVCAPYGAGVICNNEVLSGVFAKLLDDFYIIPSSIHEVLVVGKRELNDNAEFINPIIRQINGDASCISSDEVLSNSLYEYSHVTQEIKIAEV